MQLIICQFCLLLIPFVTVSTTFLCILLCYSRRLDTIASPPIQPELVILRDSPTSGAADLHRHFQFRGSSSENPHTDHTHRFMTIMTIISETTTSQVDKPIPTSP